MWAYLSTSFEVIILKKNTCLYQSVSEISILQKCHFCSSGPYACVPILRTPSTKMNWIFLNNTSKDLNIFIWKEKATKIYIRKLMVVWVEKIEKRFFFTGHPVYNRVVYCILICNKNEKMIKYLTKCIQTIQWLNDAPDEINFLLVWQNFSKIWIPDLLQTINYHWIATF